MSKFKLPETLVGLSLEDLAELRTNVRAEINKINDAEGELSPESMEELAALLDGDDAIDARVTEVRAEEAENAARAESLRARVAGLDAATEEEQPAEETPAEEPVVDEAPAEVVAEEVAEPELVVAAATRQSPVRQAAKQSPTVIIKKEETPVESPISITAAANVPDFNSGQKLDGMEDITKAFLARTGTFGASSELPAGQSYQLSPQAARHGVARIRKSNPKFSVDRTMSAGEQMQVIMDAGDERKLPKGSLTAAGGWCAPSETDYALFGLESAEGLFDIAEVVAGRGGINFTKGPDLATLLADPNSGFIQTETQAEAGDVKPCYALECPPFEEVRLDAIGYCVTAPLLTNAAYPELTRRVLDLLGIVHARRKSQATINRISTMIGAAKVFAPISAAGSQSGTADALGALELHAMLLRQKFSMSTTATIEGVAPFWFKGAIRHELSRRLGITDPFRITDADVEGYLAARNIRLQYVYDYQPLTDANTSTGTAYPTTVDVMLWPAGAFVRLVNDVISLDAVYDHDLLTQNTYTAAFLEEGIAVANRVGSGVKVTIALNYEGASGYPAIGAPTA